MSSSPRRVPVAASAGMNPATDRSKETGDIRPQLVVEPFPYDAIPLGVASRPSWLGALGKSAPDASAESAAREAQARSQGREEGRGEARQQFETQIAHERSGIAAALAEFAGERAVYFQKVEAEVVQLALSIARKILHREAQIDPLLLAGIVRVALEKIDGATSVVLRTHPRNASEWGCYLASHLEPSHLPRIAEDPLQATDACILETSMGTAMVSVEMQLKEIEQGLTDLLAARPGATCSSVQPDSVQAAQPVSVQPGIPL
jgi:flagellar assembly protein FliH